MKKGIPNLLHFTLSFWMETLLITKRKTEKSPQRNNTLLYRTFCKIGIYNQESLIENISKNNCVIKVWISITDIFVVVVNLLHV